MKNTLVMERGVQRIVGNYCPMVEYPRTKFAQLLRQVASLIHAKLKTRIYFLSHEGSDTHANQLETRARLLKELSDAPWPHFNTISVRVDRMTKPLLTRTKYRQLSNILFYFSHGTS